MHVQQLQEAQKLNLAFKYVKHALTALTAYDKLIPMKGKMTVAEAGRKGGKKSKRTLTTEQARAMVAKREEKRRLRGKS